MGESRWAACAVLTLVLLVGGGPFPVSAYPVSALQILEYAHDFPETDGGVLGASVKYDAPSSSGFNSFKSGGSNPWSHPSATSKKPKSAGFHPNVGVSFPSGGGFGFTPATTKQAPKQPAPQALKRTAPTAGGAPGPPGTFDFSALIAELFAGSDAALQVIAGLNPDDNPDLSFVTLDLSANDGVVDADTIVALNSGFNVIDVVVGDGGYLNLDNANLIIDGPEDAFGVFRVPDGIGFLASNGNILLGNSGIGVENVLFFSGGPTGDYEHLGFSNTILNGIAFWTFGPNPEPVTALADNCGGSGTACANDLTTVPEPSTIWVMSLGVGLLGIRGILTRRGRLA